MKYSNLCHWGMWISLAGLFVFPDQTLGLLAAAFLFNHRAKLETISEDIAKIRREVKS